MQEKENILRILKETKKALQKRDAATIKSLSNQTTNTAALTHDADNISIAVLVYAISKILERRGYQKLPGWKEFYKTIFKCINSAILSVKQDDEEKIKQDLDCLKNSIMKISGNLKKDIEDILIKAKINKASKIYEHGMSMEKTAKLLGVTLFDIANYIGQRPEENEFKEKGLSTKQRVKLAMDLFK